MNWQQELQRLAHQAGSLLQSGQGIPQIQMALEGLQLDPLLNGLDQLPYGELEKRIRSHRQRYKDLPLDEQAHRLVIDRTVELARSGLAGSLVPVIGGLFAVSAEQAAKRQVELAAELALLYGRSPSDEALRHEIATILTSVMAGKALIKTGADLLQVVPLGGAVVSASSTAAMTYAIGQAAMQYQKAIAGTDGGPSAVASAVCTSSEEARRYLTEAVSQEQRLDQVLLHLALADIASTDRERLLERLQPLALDPSRLEDLVDAAQALPPLGSLLEGLDEGYGAVLLTQAEQLVRSDGQVSQQEAALLRQISDVLRQRVALDAADFGNRVLSTDFKATVRGLAFSGDGEWLLAVSDDGQLKGWRSYDGGIQYHLHYELAAHEREIRSLYLCGDCLYTAGEDRQIAIWNYRQGTPVLRFDSGYSHGIFSLAICGDATLASGGWKGELTLWNAQTGAARRSLEGHSASIWALLSHPDGRLISAGNDAFVKIWDLSSGDCIQQIKHPEGVYSLALSPDGTILATGCWDQKIRLWDLEHGDLLQTLEGHTASVWQVAFSPDGCYLYSGADDKQLRIWELATGSLRLQLEGHTHGIFALALSPVQPLLASGSWDRSVRLWSIELD